RQTGHVCVFSSPPYSSAQRQNIFVRVFRCACTSSPMTGSHSGIQTLLRLAQRGLDVVVHLDHADAVLERALRLDHPEPALAGLELELHLADQHGARAVEDARLRAEHPLDGRHELCRGIVEAHRHRTLPALNGRGTGSKPSACSSAKPTPKSVL